MERFDGYRNQFLKRDSNDEKNLMKRKTPMASEAHECLGRHRGVSDDISFKVKSVLVVTILSSVYQSGPRTIVLL